MKPSSFFLLLSCSTALNLGAQIGDKPGEAQTSIVPQNLIPPAPALSPEDELKSFQIAPGYKIELVAADPLIGDPVAITFGPDGRIWVVEMRGYMPDLDGTGEDQPLGRIVVLSDTDGDGRMDKREVFLDKIVLPRAIALAHGGVLVGTPPQLLFCRDTDGDGKADEQIEIANDYGVKVDPARPQLANPERAPNSLLWALDNWIYSGAYTAKFQYRNGKWIRETTTFRGQWGLSQDDWGHLFYNSNSDQLRADLFPSHYLGRNPHATKPQGNNWKVAPQQFVWPSRVNPGINRGYRPESLLDYRLKEFTAACAPWIYRGDLFPKDAYGNAFICEPAGNLIKRNILTSKDGTLTAQDAYSQREFLTSTDERFRPVNLSTGPDGALYIVDFYRGIIQHRISLTSYLRHHIEQQGLAQPVALGRIWRVVPENVPIKKETPLANQTTVEWIKELSHANAWRRETAQRLLIEKNDPALVPDLMRAAISAPSNLGRLHALWTLDGVNAANWATVRAALKDTAPEVRVAALRISEKLLSSEHRVALLNEWQNLAETESVPEVQLQLALSMGEAKQPTIDITNAALWQKNQHLPLLKDALLSGLSERELELFEALLSNQPTQFAPLLSELARCVFAERNTVRVEKCLHLLSTLPSTESALQFKLLKSIASHPSVNAKYPVKLSHKPNELLSFTENSTGPLKDVLLQIQNNLLWPDKPGTISQPATAPLSAADQLRFDSGKQLFSGICAACHQTHGKGMEGLAPPLVDSEWVLGSPERLSRIVLHGVRGPIKVKGAGFNLDMPALGFLDDAQIASILTYIRREWDHTAPPIASETVRDIRHTETARKDAWTETELLSIP
ncbi:MAG: c-type cytochrome [Verrucomicrobiota bacterium]